MAKIEATWTGRGYLTPEEERERLYERFRQLQQDIARSRQARSKSTDCYILSSQSNPFTCFHLLRLIDQMIGRLID
jgi:DNA-binding transcriptional LysR family regulator